MGQGPCDRFEPFLRMCRGQIDKAFVRKVPNDCMENLMSQIRHNPCNGGDLERAPKPRELVAMQKTVRRWRGTEHGIWMNWL